MNMLRNFVYGLALLSCISVVKGQDPVELNELELLEVDAVIDNTIHLPKWLLEDPSGSNALTTVVTLDSRPDVPLFKETVHFHRFWLMTAKYDQDKASLFVARSQNDFNWIMSNQVGLEYDLPRALDFDKEMILFLFVGPKDANNYTIPEFGELMRGQPIKLNKSEVYDAVMVNANITYNNDVGIKGLSPWTMIRINKELFFKNHPLTKDTHFVLILSKDAVTSSKELPVPR